MPPTSGRCSESIPRSSDCPLDPCDMHEEAPKVTDIRTPARHAATAGTIATAARVVDAVDELRAAVRLLTRLRIGRADDRVTDRSGAAAFPIVGALVGAIGMVPLMLAGSLQPLVASVLSLATVAVLTGALHLDGL